MNVYYVRRGGIAESPTTNIDPVSVISPTTIIFESNACVVRPYTNAVPRARTVGALQREKLMANRRIGWSTAWARSCYDSPTDDTAQLDFTIYSYAVGPRSFVLPKNYCPYCISPAVCGEWRASNIV